MNFERSKKENTFSKKRFFTEQETTSICPEIMELSRQMNIFLVNFSSPRSKPRKRPFPFHSVTSTDPRGRSSTRNRHFCPWAIYSRGIHPPIYFFRINRNNGKMSRPMPAMSYRVIRTVFRIRRVLFNRSESDVPFRLFRRRKWSITATSSFSKDIAEGLLVEPTLLFRVCFDHFIDVVVANRIFYE